MLRTHDSGTWRRTTNKQNSRGQLLAQMTQRDAINRGLNDLEQTLGQAERNVSRRHYAAAYDRANNLEQPCNTLQRVAKPLSLAVSYA